MTFPLRQLYYKNQSYLTLEHQYILQLKKQILAFFLSNYQIYLFHIKLSFLKKLLILLNSNILDWSYQLIFLQTLIFPCLFFNRENYSVSEKIKKIIGVSSFFLTRPRSSRTPNLFFFIFNKMSLKNPMNQEQILSYFLLYLLSKPLDFK